MPVVDCIYERGQFFLPLSLAGSAPHYFVFDTGAGVSAVDEGLATELGLSSSRSGGHAGGEGGPGS